MKIFLKGVLLLAVASFVGESLEFFINMILARQLGEHGMGQYMSIFPLIILIIILASLELPISISKFIAEKDERFHYSMLRHAMTLTLVFTVSLFFISSVALPFFHVFHQYHPMIQWLVLLLIPLISLTSMARGYFMGKQQMGKIAFAGFLRKAVQLLLLIFIYQAFSFTKTTAILIAIATLIGSEFVVFIYLFTSYLLQLAHVKNLPRTTLRRKTVISSLMAVSLPTTGLRIFHALSNAIQPFLIKSALMASGFTHTAATSQFGLLAGVAATIGFFPAFIAHSLLVVLIPTVSESYAQKDMAKLKKLLVQVMIITSSYGIPAVAVFYFWANPLTHLFFHSTEAALYLKMLWPSFLCTFFLIPMQAYLIGLGLIKAALFQSIWATSFSFIVMYFLGSRASMQMSGIIIGMNLGTVMIMFMHYITVCSKIGVTFMLKSPSKKL